MKNKTSITHKIRHFFYALLRAVIQFQINNNLFAREYLPIGAWVVYNWKAKIMIDTAIKNKMQPKRIAKYIYETDKNIEFTDGDSCSPFWVRRLYFWEHKPNCP